MGHAVLLGPIKRDAGLTLVDGTVYDVNGDVAYAATAEHAAELAHLVGLHYEQHGHPDHDADKPFGYERGSAFEDYTPHPDNGLEG